MLGSKPSLFVFTRPACLVDYLGVRATVTMGGRQSAMMRAASDGESHELPEHAAAQVGRSAARSGGGGAAAAAAARRRCCCCCW